jgi:hypothetical protein
MSLKRLIYLSNGITETEFSKEALDALLVKARKNNMRLDVTGLLLYRKGNFLHILEGPEQAIQKVFRKIEDDPRHTGLLKLLDESIEERAFVSWFMGYRDLSKTIPSEYPGFDYILNQDWERINFDRFSSKVCAFVKVFVAQ